VPYIDQWDLQETLKKGLYLVSRYSLDFLPAPTTRTSDSTLSESINVVVLQGYVSRYASSKTKVSIGYVGMEMV
jgi:hypothetical protein